MQFLFPTFLFALTALVIPIIIHLFHFRRFQTIYFTNVRFLREVKNESANRRKLRDLLVLLARCLAVLFLVLAFVQPFISKNTNAQKGAKNISVYIDNSFSMNALSRDVSLLEKAKIKAREIVAAYHADDKFQILTNDFEGRHQRLVNKEEALTFIDEVKSSPNVQPIATVLNKQLSVLNTNQKPSVVNHQPSTIYCISDFQKNISDLLNFKDSLTEVNLVPLEAVEQKNISIDSAWFEKPVQTLGQTAPLIVRVTNHSNDNVENVKLSFNLDAQEKPIGLLNLKAHATIDDTLKVSIMRTGWHGAELTITDYPIQFDDHYFFTFNVPSVIQVLLVSDGSSNRFLETGLGASKIFKMTNQTSNSLQYSDFPKYQMIVLNGLHNVSSGLSGELVQYIQNGGNVIVFPEIGIDAESYNNFTNAAKINGFGSFETALREVVSFNADEFIFNDVFLNKSANLKLPSTTGNFKLMNRSGENLMIYRDGSSFLTKNKIGKGNVYMCAAPLNDKYSNLVRTGEVFVPMLYKMAISSSKDKQNSLTIGKDDFIEVDTKNLLSGTNYKMKLGNDEFIPEQRLLAGRAILGVRGAIHTAGVYDVFTKPDSVLYKIGFNYDRRESVLEYLDKKSLQTYTRKNVKILDAYSEANFTHLVGENNQGIVLWRWCIALSLLFLLSEVLLLRFFRA